MEYEETFVFWEECPECGKRLWLDVLVEASVEEEDIDNVVVAAKLRLSKSIMKEAQDG